MHTPPRTGRAVGALCAAVVLAATLGVSGASADPGGSDDPTPSQAQVDHAKQDVATKARSVKAIRADLASAQRDLDAASTAAEIAAERYNGAAWQLGLARKAQKKADAKATKAAHDVKGQRSRIARLVVQNFRGGTQMDQLTAMLDAQGPSDVLQKYGVLHSASASMDAQYDRYRSTLTRSKVAQRQAHAAKAKAAKLARTTKQARDAAAAAQDSAGAREASLQARTTALTAQLAKAQHISVKLATTRARAIRLAAARAAAAKAARDAAAQAARQAADSPTTGSSGTSGSSDDGGGDGASDTPSDPPSTGSGDSGDGSDNGSGGSTSGGSSGGSDGGSTAPSGGASAAIAFAKSQLGDPYRWGATGPSSWDCSGLMLKAWAAGGKSLPRTSAAQYGAIQHITRSQLQPGDLIFWGSSPGGIHHVAMYLGNNQMIHAPRTGQDVKTSSVDYWIPPNYFGRP